MNKRTAFSTAALLAIVTSFSSAVLAVEGKSSTSVTTQPAATAPTTPTTSTPITKDQAVEMALKAHPGKVAKAYEDTRKGKKTWEVKINGDDGKKWEVYYEINTGELVDEVSK